MSFKKLISTLLICVGLVVTVSAQVTVRGIVTDEGTGSPVRDASVSVSGKALFASTDAAGAFQIPNVPKGKCVLVITRAGYLPMERSVDVQPTVQGDEFVRIALQKDPDDTSAPTSTSVPTASGEIPTVTLDEAESETDGAGEVANLLHASRDLFQQYSGFGWSAFRFRERGYESENFPLYLNGVNINDPETGGAFFGEFGGLNDVLRARETTVGMDASEFAFTEIGGATRIDTRASSQRKQIRASYAASNRTYRHRVMLTMNSGLMPKGWAVSASFSRRWAEEGWYEGTPFDGYSYFFAVDKKFKKHTFSATILGAPTKRGRNGDTFEEMIDLAGTTRYNPNWGYWNGEKRNANMTHSHQPIGLLRWDWAPDSKTSVSATAYGQAGKRGSSRLDWFNASNPFPDYYRRLPSSLDDPELTSRWAATLRNDQALRQIDWAGIYEGNSINRTTVYNADGIPENTVSGKQSSVFLGDFREDSKELGFNGLFRRTLTDRITLHAGTNYQYYLGRNFKLVDDLLGGDFHVDTNPFAQQDFPDNPNALNNDIRTPNNVVREGETYGWDYDENIRKAGVWAQGTMNLRKWSLFAGGTVNNTQFWRTGHMQNGRFPDNSLGDSKKANFNTFGSKVGITYKMNGRNYVYGNGYYGTRAPLFRDIFLSPRTRNTFFEQAKPYKITSGEVGFIHRSPLWRTRVTGYWTKFDDQYESFTLFGQAVSSFGTEVRAGVDQINSGIEAAFEVKPFTQWAFGGATNLGYYRYTSRPTLYFYEDNTAIANIDGVAIYQNNYLVPRTPQTTASANVRYEGKKFWFASLTLNFADDMWFEFDRERRTADYAVQVAGTGVVKDSDVWNAIFDQKIAPAAYTLDLFAGKSWRIKYKYFINLNVGVNNILDNRNILASAREAYSRAFKEVDDVRLYSNEVIYAPGTNYFIGLTLRM